MSGPISVNKSHHHADIVIIGAGIIGLLSAKAFAESGRSVILLEKGKAGQEASFAGGGILSSLQPWKQPDSLLDLIHWSQKRYPTLCRKLHETTGIDPEFERSGLLIVDEPLSEQQRHQLRCYESKYYSRPHAESLFGGININSHTDYLSDTAHVRNPKLLNALQAWVARHPNIELHEQQAVTSLQTERTSIISAKTTTSHYSADHFVIAAGAWSKLLTDQFDLQLPIKPIRGQMLRLQPSNKSSKPLLTSILLHQGTYLIPRRSGKILVGSTLEDCGFDKSTTPEAYQSLRTKAEYLVPELASADLLDHWAGLRPGCSKEHPIIDNIPNIENGYICAGHFRYGLTSAPASAALLLSRIEGHPPPAGLKIEHYRLNGSNSLKSDSNKHSLSHQSQPLTTTL